MTAKVPQGNLCVRTETKFELGEIELIASDSKSKDLACQELGTAEVEFQIGKSNERWRVRVPSTRPL